MTFLDARRQRADLSYDIAIYGAGAAGITLARTLAPLGVRIGLFEAGGFERPPVDADHSYHGNNTGLPYDLKATRLRYFGGTTNHWGGWCRPLDAYDFQAHDHVPLSGWPVSRDELNPYLARALDVCEVATGGLGLVAFDQDFGFGELADHTPTELALKNFLFSPPTRFGVRYRDDIGTAENVECQLNATLVRIEVAAGSVDRCVVATASGSRLRIAAECHVLALGALENARLLLASNVANNSGYVGRCFSDHLGKHIGWALLDFNNRFHTHQAVHAGQHFRVLPHLSFRDDLIEDRKLVNFGLILNRLSGGSSGALGKAMERQAQSLAGAEKSPFRVLLRMENTPNPASRVELTNERDPWGLPRVALNWQLNRLDMACVERLCETLGRAFGKMGGRLRVDARSTAVTYTGAYQSHQLGTTRMSSDPGDGVVDPSLRCHEVANLYLAGSSVFPTFGFANPTLTIIALTLRLAEHLRQRLGITDA
ncbi:MAG: GMC family oxidoreductase [Gammaproteobacteria bacterium]|nr:GMC family oxidoreductase [Gammaproteobacteria bacterium]